jgi:nucleoporin p58/p45
VVLVWKLHLCNFFFDMNLLFFFVQVEDIHQAVEAMRIQYLNDRRCWGDWNDPFVEADTRESAKQEAAVRIVHPTLHLPPPSQPKTPVITSVVASQLPQSSVPIVGTFPRSCPTLPPPILLTASSLQPSHAPTTNPFSSSSITSSVTSFSHHHMEGIHHIVAHAVG